MSEQIIYFPSSHVG